MDTLGNLMDQDLDGTPGEEFQDALRTQQAIDLTPPRVTRVVPSGDLAETAASIDVFFSEGIDAATLASSDIAITAPGGTPASITAITRVTDSIHRVSFTAQTAFGLYSIRVGPHIADPSGNELDQDRNGIPGALPGNYYLIVRADLYNQEKEAGRKGNNVAVSAALPLSARSLVSGSDAHGTLKIDDRADYYCSVTQALMCKSGPFCR